MALPHPATRTAPEVTATAFPTVVPMAVGVAAALAATWVWAVDPATSGPSIPCPLHAVTGWWCPLCGATRGIHHLLHGDLPGALSRNALLALIVPMSLLWWVSAMAGSLGVPVRARPMSGRWWAFALGVVLAFTVARNTSALGSLAP